MGMTNPQIEQVNPLMTRRCSNQECDEVIYRDTLDKDLGYHIVGTSHSEYYCSKKCAKESYFKTYPWRLKTPRSIEY